MAPVLKTPTTRWLSQHVLSTLDQVAASPICADCCMSAQHGQSGVTMSVRYKSSWKHGIQKTRTASHDAVNDKVAIGALDSTRTIPGELGERERTWIRISSPTVLASTALRCSYSALRVFKIQYVCTAVWNWPRTTACSSRRTGIQPRRRAPERAE